MIDENLISITGSKSFNNNTVKITLIYWILIFWRNALAKYYSLLKVDDLSNWRLTIKYHKWLDFNSSTSRCFMDVHRAYSIYYKYRDIHMCRTCLYYFIVMQK